MHCQRAHERPIANPHTSQQFVKRLNDDGVQQLETNACIRWRHCQRKTASPLVTKKRCRMHVSNPCSRIMQVSHRRKLYLVVSERDCNIPQCQTARSLLTKYVDKQLDCDR
jgi:hypothetical protein